jgi:hypothetical protein
MKVITTRPYHQKIKGTAIDPKFKKSIKRQSTKVFQTDDQRPFDVYNLGTASTLGRRNRYCWKTGTAENFAKIGKEFN